MRKPLIVGNWKMHGSLKQVQTLIQELVQGASVYDTIDIAVCPSNLHILAAKDQLAHSNLQLGSQNLHQHSEGAYTGEISGPMLKDAGCHYVLVGHSERRSLFHEDLLVVAHKFAAAIQAGLQPILCVGETQLERFQGRTEQVIATQIESVWNFVDASAFAQAIIAYEPIWAIGTGITAKPSEAQAVHEGIRALISKNNVDIAKAIRILYGGSMKASNAADLLAMPDIDGGLVGGASLQAREFLAICEAAHRRSMV